MAVAQEPLGRLLDLFYSLFACQGSDLLTRVCLVAAWWTLSALAKQAKIDFEEQILREKRYHEQIAVERAQACYKKHYSICAEILDQIVDLSTKVADYRMLTNKSLSRSGGERQGQNLEEKDKLGKNTETDILLIPYKLMHDWKELFFNGKPVYEQASVKTLPANPSREQLIELEKRDLLDTNDYEEYKVPTNMK
ncbi:Sperm flagellar protein 2 [Saguinus oedipus]|uniref:Sperm flagellar protein 2 n=1 Tax=Saguinus oedipus TaxID=9490 RepID=A0ABQ9W8H4_SAGOE|nr:Sperm flagellar protein 2 [Saguinus oedipus]